MLFRSTTIRHPPAGFGSDSYTVALIECQDRTKIMAQLTGSIQPFIGAQVVPHLRKIRTMENGLIVHDLKYEVLAETTEPLITVRSYVLAVSGPTGVGKSTIADRLFSLASLYAERVPVITTRRAKKTDTDPYVHVSDAQFKTMIAAGELCSFAEIASGTTMKWYGYRRADIEAIWKKGKLPIVVTNTALLQGLVSSLGRRAVLSCGLLPPGTSRRSMLSALLHRLRQRGHHTEPQIEHRLKAASEDLEAVSSQAHLFDHVLVNDDLSSCIESMKKLVEG